MAIKVGDWVNVTAEEIDEQDTEGRSLGALAKRNAVAHVLNDAGEGWFDVFFEKSGTISVVHESEIARLCGPDGSDVGAR
jgi:hypothetical protein